jgi:hypothetical protein
MTPAVAARAARSRRIANIRRAVIGLSLALFIALFAGLYVQMAAGRDPVLGSQTTAGRSAASSGSSGSSGSTGSTTSTGGSGSSASSASSASTPPAAVTTSQS